MIVRYERKAKVRDRVRESEWEIHRESRKRESKIEWRGYMRKTETEKETER